MSDDEFDDEFESGLDEIEQDPWDERDRFLEEHADEDIQVKPFVLVLDKDGEDPLA